MPEVYYIIPATIDSNGRNRPMYVDEIRSNWTGHFVENLNVFICKVNTTEIKHSDLNSRSLVFQLPRNYTWETVISTMPTSVQNFITNWCVNHSIPFDESETIGQFLMRVINTGLFGVESSSVNTVFSEMNLAQRNKIITLCNNWNIPLPTESETLRQISDRCGPVWWDGSKLSVREF